MPRDRKLLCQINPFREEDGFRIYGAVYRRTGGDESSFELIYKLPASLKSISDDDAEPWLIAGFMLAMEENRSFHVYGKASNTLMAGLENFRAAWVEWHPDKYHPVEFSVDEIVKTGRRHQDHENVLVPFSGGVDSSFSLWRHKLNQAGYRSRQITHVAMVHGLDIPYGEVEPFQAAFQKNHDYLEKNGIPLFPVVTNYREVIKGKWLEYFGVALVSSLYFAKSECQTLLIPSSETYSVGCLESGSNPVTDPLLSGDDMGVIHDGADASRAEKIKSLARWGLDVNALRVCWMSPERSSNCGACEKCMRTRIAFMATGLIPPESLCRSDTLQDIKKLKITKPIYEQAYEAVLAAARNTGVQADWIKPLEKKVSGYRKKSLMKKWVKEFLPDRPHAK